MAIAQYVCGVPAKNLAPPNGTLEGAKLQFWLNFTSSERQLSCFCPLFDREILTDVKAKFADVDSRLAQVERHLVERAYLLGSDFSIADVYPFVVSNWARSVHLDLSPYPSVPALRERIGQRPAVQEAMRKENLVR